ncbi:hypothetical protein E6R61_36810 [Streptomyces sp. LRa12]|nr:hypothetical protein E6R61_36810 [Streptomyces sp. LRa12]
MRPGPGPGGGRAGRAPAGAATAAAALTAGGRATGAVRPPTVTTRATPAVAARPAEAGRPAGEGAADAAEAAADTGQLSLSVRGNRIPSTGPAPGAGPRVPTTSARRAILPVGARTPGALRTGGVCARVEQLSCGAP